MRRILLVFLFAFAAFAASHTQAFASCGGVPNTFSNGTAADANQVNANFSALVSCAQNVDNTQIGTGGIFASQIIPTSIAQATFASAFGYTFNNGLTVNSGLTANGGLTVTGGVTLGTALTVPNGGTNQTSFTSARCVRSASATQLASATEDCFTMFNGGSAVAGHIVFFSASLTLSSCGAGPATFCSTSTGISLSPAFTSTTTYQCSYDISQTGLVMQGKAGTSTGSTFVPGMVNTTSINFGSGGVTLTGSCIGY